MNRTKAPALSQQTKAAILQYIHGMDLQKETKLPREIAMAELFGVSRITIRRALDELEAEGRIFRKHGRGTFVNAESQNIIVTFNPVMEFMQLIRKSGYKPSMKLVDFRIVEDREDVRQKLRLEQGEKLIEADKAFFADGRLCMFCRDFYSMSLSGAEEYFGKNSVADTSLYPYLYEKSGIRLVWDKVEIDTVISTEIKGFETLLKEEKVGVRPYLYLREVDHGEKDQPLIYVEEYVDTSIIKYNMIRQKNIDYGRS